MHFALKLQKKKVKRLTTENIYSLTFTAGEKFSGLINVQPQKFYRIRLRLFKYEFSESQRGKLLTSPAQTEGSSAGRIRAGTCGAARLDSWAPEGQVTNHDTRRRDQATKPHKQRKHTTRSLLLTTALLTWRMMQKQIVWVVLLRWRGDTGALGDRTGRLGSAERRLQRYRCWFEWLLG